MDESESVVGSIQFGMRLELLRNWASVGSDCHARGFGDELDLLLQAPADHGVVAVKPERNAFPVINFFTDVLANEFVNFLLRGRTNQVREKAAT